MSWHTVAVLLVGPALLLAAEAESREQEILAQRRLRLAQLKPEPTSRLVDRLNDITRRGLLEGAQPGNGANGFKVVLGGMRSGHGPSFGAGYRRTDLLAERLALRASARGTPRQAFLFDLELSSPRLNTRRFDLNLYFKYENSPWMDYYGAGPNSARANRSSYRLEDFSVDVQGRYRLWRNLFAGASAGRYLPNTGPGKRPGFPTTEQKFSPSQTPGLEKQASFLRTGLLLQFDSRDHAANPRSGGHYFARYRRYFDRSLAAHNFSELWLTAEHYLPYWNQTRVIALRLAADATFAPSGQSVPFYLQPTLGGNERLRGFERYRFYDQNALAAAVEHRWHLFSNGHAALFFEAGKVTPKASQLNFHRLEYSGGLGFRFTLRNAVIMRIDHAVSREGYRLVWTFSNPW